MDARDRAAALYRQLGPAVYRRCLRLLRNPDAARDATQEVFVKLVRDMDRLEDRDAVLPWLYRVATNHCLNRLRDGRRHGEEPLPETYELADGAGRDELPARQLATRVLDRFDAETRAVAVGVLVDGMEHEEVASALGISRRTVARKLERFLVNARKILARSGP
jgi:RNA polymerase sigma-70 factor (ECF subfamily)